MEFFPIRKIYMPLTAQSESGPRTTLLVEETVVQERAVAIE